MSNDKRPDAITEEEFPVINLAAAPGERQAWDKPSWIVYAWAAVELLFVTNPWQISSRLRIAALRTFGATIEAGVIFRPRTRVKFPWKLSVGENSWIGEGVWIHNQDHVSIGKNVVVSQESFLTTGSHAHLTDMGLVTRPISIGDGTWVTSRCILLGGTSLGENCLITPGTVVSGNLPRGTKFGSAPGVILGERRPKQ